MKKDLEEISDRNLVSFFAAELIFIGETGSWPPGLSVCRRKAFMKRALVSRVYSRRSSHLILTSRVQVILEEASP